MATDEVTPVIFRKEKDKYGLLITAVFPTMPADFQGNVTCYAHVGQHGACSQGWYYGTKPASPEEYADLLKELVEIGYDNLQIRRKWLYSYVEQARQALAR